MNTINLNDTQIEVLACEFKGIESITIKNQLFKYYTLYLGYSMVDVIKAWRKYA